MGMEGRLRGNRYEDVHLLGAGGFCIDEMGLHWIGDLLYFTSMGETDDTRFIDRYGIFVM
jgi:hypothetical protein